MSNNSNGNGNGESTTKTRLDNLDEEFQARVRTGKPPAAKEVSEALKTWKAANDTVKKHEAALRKAEQAASGTIEAIVKARGRSAFALDGMKYQFVCRGESVFLREIGAKPVVALDDLMK